MSRKPGDVKGDSALARRIRTDRYRRASYEIAADARIAPHVLSTYTSGKKKIPEHHLARLAVVLECEPEDLLDN